MAATPAWLGAVEVVLNRNIAAQARPGVLARRLEGKSLRIDIEGLIRLRAVCVGGRLALMAGDDSEADALITGPPAALIRLLAADADRPLGKASLQVRGDAEVAAGYRELMHLARPDPEEEMARVIGDVPARRLGNFGRHAFSFLRRAGRTFGENIAEYLQEESRDLPSKPEVEDFLSGVDELREAKDRVDARIARLERLQLGRAGPGAA